MSETESRPSDRTAIIAGAGLAGSLLACLLARRGWTVSLHERRSDPRARGFIGGRSINLALSTRGITALERANVADTVLETVIPMPGRLMHSRAGEETFQPYSRESERAINSVSRSGLNLTLLEAAGRYESVRMHFDHRLEDVDLEAGRATFVDKTGTRVEHSASLIVGADGAFSALRGKLQRQAGFDYSQDYLEHGYKELVIPPADDETGPHGRFRIEPNALHIWPRGGSMMIALPNQDGSFTCTLFWPLEGGHSFGGLPETAGDADIRSFFEREYGDAVPHMPTLVADYRENPTSRLVTVRCRPWHWGDRVCLVGDAAHAIVPFYGQGMNAAFEDCRVLDELLEANGDDPARVLPEYTRLRKPAGDAIADLALANFIEMRDRVASPLFLARKKLEKFVNGVMPKTFTPLYDLVSFSNVPYHEARAKARRQDRVLAGSCIALAVLLLAAGVTLLATFFGGSPAS